MQRTDNTIGDTKYDALRPVVTQGPAETQDPAYDEEAIAADEIIPIQDVSTNQTVETTSTKPSVKPVEKNVFNPYSPVKYLTIIISPNIEFVPKMIVKESNRNNVLFNPLIKYNEDAINNPTVNPNDKYTKTPLKQTDPKYRYDVYNQFFNEGEFSSMLSNSVNAGQRSYGEAINENFNSLFNSSDPQKSLRFNKTIEQATSEGIVDANILATLNTLFATNNVLYINGDPYTVFSYSWNKEWQIDTKLPRNFEFGTSPYGSSYGSDNYYRYKTDQIKIADEELSKIPEKALMSDSMRNRIQKQEGTEIITSTTLKTTTTTYTLRIGANLGNATNLAGLANLEYLANFQMNYGCRKTITPMRDAILDPISFSLILTDDFLSENNDLKASYDNSTQKNNAFATAYNKFYASFGDVLTATQKIVSSYDDLKKIMFNMDLTDDVEQKRDTPPIQTQGGGSGFSLFNNTQEAQLEKTPLFYALSKIQNSYIGKFGYLFNLDLSTKPTMVKVIKNLVDISDAAVKIFDSAPTDNELLLQEQINSLNQNPNEDSKLLLDQLNKKMKQKVDSDNKKINIVREFNRQLESLKTMNRGENYITEINKIHDEYNAAANNQFDKLSKIKTSLTINKTPLEKGRTTLIENIQIIKDNIRAFSLNLRVSIDAYKKLIESQMLCFKTFISTLLMLKNYFKKHDVKHEDKHYITIINNDIALYDALNEYLDKINYTNFTRHLDILLISMNEQHELLYSSKLVDLYSKNLFSMEADQLSFNNFVNEYVKMFMQSNNYILEQMQNTSNATYSQFVGMVRKNMESYSPTMSSSISEILSSLPIAISSAPTTELAQSAVSEKTKKDTYKLIHTIIALTEIMCGRTINNLSQVNYSDEVFLSIAKMEIDLFEIFKKGMQKKYDADAAVQCLNPAYFNIKKSDLDNLLKMFSDAKANILDKEVSNYSKFAFFKEQCNKLFKQLLPTQKQPVKNMCDLISAGDEIKFEVRSVETFMTGKSYNQNNEAQIAFQNKLMEFMNSTQTTYKFNEPNYVKFWKLYSRESVPGDAVHQIITVVNIILNGQLHLENKVSAHEWSRDGMIEFETPLEEHYSKNVTGLLNAFKKAFKIKFFILDLDNVNGFIDTKLCDTPNEEEKDDIVEGGADVTDFALIVKYNNQYFIPYNLYFNTLLYSVDQLKTLDIDILIQFFCGKKFKSKTNTTKTIDRLSSNAQKKQQSAINQKGGVAPIVTTSSQTSIQRKPVQMQTDTNTNKNARDENIKRAYTKESKLSYYVVIDLVLWPGTSINPAQKLKLTCQTNAEEVRRAWSEWQGLIYIPPPLLVNANVKDNRIDSYSDMNRMLQSKSISTILKENNKYDQLKGDDFFDVMKKQIIVNEDFMRAFAVLSIASDEYNNLMLSHDINSGKLNELITDAKNIISSRQ